MFLIIIYICVRTGFKIISNQAYELILELSKTQIPKCLVPVRLKAYLKCLNNISLFC